MKYSNCFFYIILYCTLTLSCVCESRLFMVSQEGKLQISDDYGETWAPYDLGFPVDHIEFFDVYYNASINTVYVAGYDKPSNTLVLLYITNGTVYQDSHTTILLWYPTPEDNIEFMKVRPGFNTINIFGRIRYSTPYVLFPNNQSFFRGLRENFHIFQQGGSWYRIQPFLKFYSTDKPVGATILDIMTVPNIGAENANYVYTISDPEAPGPYPFYRSKDGHARIIKTSQPHTEQHLVDRREIHRVFSLPHTTYPILYQNPETHEITLLGENGGGIFSQTVYGYPYSFQQNSKYSLFGTALFYTPPLLDHEKSTTPPHNESLFFVLEKQTPVYTRPRAVIAHGNDLSSLRVVQAINNSLQVEGITREIGARALKEDHSFYRFVVEQGYYLFFFSFIDEYDINHTLVLKSKDGKEWKPLGNDRKKPLLPKKIREIISVP